MVEELHVEDLIKIIEDYVELGADQIVLNSGADKKVIHPLTQEPTDRNPVLLSSKRNEVPTDLDAVALDQFIARGGVALACNLAFEDMVEITGSGPRVMAASPKELVVL